MASDLRRYNQKYSLFSLLSCSVASFKFDNIFFAKFPSSNNIFSSGFCLTAVKIICSRSGAKVIKGKVSLNLVSFCISKGINFGRMASEISSLDIFCIFALLNSPKITCKSDIGTASLGDFVIQQLTALMVPI